PHARGFFARRGAGDRRAARLQARLASCRTFGQYATGPSSCSFGVGGGRRNVGAQALTQGDFLWLVGSLCQISRVPFDAGLLLQHEPHDEAAAESFGFKWFARELVRHKRIWRDVLLASLFIQLIGLATPLGTQVIIDKVVVHQTMSTLAVIAVALAMFLAFN